MWIVSVVVFLILISPNHGKLYPPLTDTNSELLSCVEYTIKTYFMKHYSLTYVDFNSDDKNIVKTINNQAKVGIVTKTTKIQYVVKKDMSYLIMAKNVEELITGLQSYRKQNAWNPCARFFILFTEVINDDLPKLFNALLEFHVTNVLVMDHSSDPCLFTYNPFENYACGKRYDKIIDNGKCSTIRRINLFPYQLSTGLKNCSFKIFFSHFPPFVIKPSVKRVKFHGLEQHIIDEVRHLEKLNVIPSYSDDADKNAFIHKQGLTTSGPLHWLLNGSVDIVAGGMVLMEKRAMIYDYTYPILIDEISCLVKKATVVPFWKHLYLEFSLIVWGALLFTLCLYFIFYSLVVQPKDKVQFLLRMVECLLLGGRSIKGNCLTKYLFILWVWFAYIINIYYQSKLVSLINHPVTHNQISNENDLIKYKMKPCVDRVVKNCLESEEYSVRENEEDCLDALSNIYKVSQNSHMYTLVQNWFYTYHKYKFYDDSGHCILYKFKGKFRNMLYVIYMYRGFPLIDKFNRVITRLREAGILTHYVRKLKWLDNKKFRVLEKTSLKNIVMIPRYALFCGYSISLMVFLLEIIIDKIKSKTANLSTKLNTLT